MLQIICGLCPRCSWNKASQGPIIVARSSDQYSLLYNLPYNKAASGILNTQSIDQSWSRTATASHPPPLVSLIGLDVWLRRERGFRRSPVRSP